MFAPGWPGIPARWTSSAKSGLGTAVSRDSRVWFTLSHGILNEIYYPRVDHACTRDLGFIVTDGQTYFSEEKRDARSETSQVAPGVPAYQIRNTAVDGRYRIEKEVLTDPWRDVVLQRVRFVPLQGTLADFRLYVLLAPHLANRGSGNTAWVGDYKGTPMLLAERDNYALALGVARRRGSRDRSDSSASPTAGRNCSANKRLDRTYPRAENGNVAVTGEIDLASSDGTFVIALGFGPTAMEAGQHALHQPARGFRRARKPSTSAGWKAWHKTLEGGTAAEGAERPLYHISAAVLRTHESKRVEGGDHRQPVDPVGLLQGRRRPGRLSPGVAAGSRRDRRRASSPSARTSTCEARAAVSAGHAGTRRPLVAEHVARRHAVLARHSDGRNGLADSAGRSRRPRRRDRLTSERDAFWPMVRRAAAFLARNGPVSPQDRWEEDPGYSPFTIAAEIAALLVAADLADAACKHDGRDVSARDGRRLERQHRTMAVCRRAPNWRQQHGVDGYYVRVARARSGRRRVAVSRFRPDQEPASGSSRPGRRR